MKKNKKFFTTIVVLMLSQAIMYWFVKLFQYNYHEINFWLDNKILFCGSFVYIYNLFYPFIFLSLYFIFKKDEKVYDRTIISGMIGYLICDLFYIIYPTVMIRADISNMTGITGLLLKITYFLDTPALNCLPSIHCLFSFMIMGAFIMSKDFKLIWRILGTIFAVLIVLSTFFIKQHYVLDAFAALIVYVVCYSLVSIFKIDEKLIGIIKDKFQNCKVN